MKRFNILKSIMVCGIAFVAMLATGCFAEQTKPYEGCELGTEKDSYEVDIYADEVQVEVFSNMTYNISLLNEADWVSFPATASKDEGFKVSYTENRGIARMAKLHLTVPEYNHADTIYIKQRGAVEEYLTCEDCGISLKGSVESSTVVSLSTNIPLNQLETVVVYGDLRDADWLSDVKIEQGDSANTARLSFNSEKNGNEDKLRCAYIDVRYIDGWNNLTNVRIFVTQKTATDADIVVSSFAELKAKGFVDGVLLEEDIVIEGVVVSNKESLNMGENSQTTTVTIDYDECLRTVYLQSLDGKSGLMLKMKSVDDNLLNRYDKVTLCLRGAKLFRSLVVAENDPTYYWLEEVEASMIINVSEGSASDIPQKKLYIKDLTDDDIFTFVELQECCLPIRKGPMTPINEGYANATGADRTAKYAIPLLDKNGASIYIYTNTTCPYRRTGERLPYGSGVMKGIIVHEKFSRFEWQDNNSGLEESYGNIGRYQIRHTEYSDFAMNKDFKDGFSNMLCEWTHVDAKNQKSYPATAGEDKSAYLTHTFEYPVGNALHGKLCLNLHGDMTYLGPIGSNVDYPFGRNVTNKNGLGVILDNGVDWMSPSYTGVNSEYAANINAAEAGKGKVPASCGSAWKVWYNVNPNLSNKPACSFIYVFSTKGVQTDHITVQFGMLNMESKGDYGPRYWNLEYSLDNSTWTKVSRFSVPDEIIWSPKTQLWMCPGYKPMSYELPADKVCGKDVVYVRFRPEPKLHGTHLEYASSVTSHKDNADRVPWSGFNYFAVRYNK